MQGTWKLVLAAVAVGMVLTLAGCGSGEKGAEANGKTSDEAGAATGNDGKGGSVQAASYPGSPAMSGAQPAQQAPPAVLIQTTLGDITVELDNENAPLTVDNFLAYVERGFYDQTIFHQVFPGAVILGGMFTPELIQKETDPPVRSEADNGLKNERGTIAMFRDYNVINSATCQFFINVKDNPNYDYKPGAQETLTGEEYGYCVFGRVTGESMKVVDQIANVEVHDTADFERIPVETVLIKSISRTR